jgi:hypothetical protein
MPAIPPAPCAAENGVVKKASGSLKIVHDPYAKNNALFER